MRTVITVIALTVAIVAGCETYTICDQDGCRTVTVCTDNQFD